MNKKERLDPKQIKERLNSDHFIRKIQVLDVVDSTNTRLVSSAKNGSSGPGTLLAAEEQTAGKGRMEHSWHSTPYESLTFSFLCENRFPKKPGWITLGAAMSVVWAVDRLLGRSTRLKWPNDVYANGKKLAGVLAQAFHMPEGPLVVVGIGINVNSTPESLSDAGDHAPACLRDIENKPVDRSALLAEILNAMDEILKRFALKETDFLVEALRECSLLLGTSAVFEWKNVEYTGKILDHTDNLGILLQTSAGTVVLPGETSKLVRFSF